MVTASKSCGIIAVALFLLIIATTTMAKYGGGNGTAEDPYQIATAEQMNAVGADPNDWRKHFKLMADIDLSAFDGKDSRLTSWTLTTGGNPLKQRMCLSLPATHPVYRPRL